MSESTVYEFRKFVDCEKCGNNSWYIFTNGVVACTNCQYEGELEPTIIFNDDDQ